MALGFYYISSFLFHSGGSPRGSKRRWACMEPAGNGEGWGRTRQRQATDGPNGKARAKEHTDNQRGVRGNPGVNIVEVGAAHGWTAPSNRYMVFPSSYCLSRPSSEPLFPRSRARFLLCTRHNTHLGRARCCRYGSCFSGGEGERARLAVAFLLDYLFSIVRWARGVVAKGKGVGLRGRGGSGECEATWEGRVDPARTQKQIMM